MKRSRQLVLMGLMTSILCLLGPVAIATPLSPIPISLCSLAILISASLLGAKYSFFSCLIYLLLGFVGLPVFAGLNGGPGNLLGPNGGYLLGYLPLSFISGWFMNKYSNLPLQALGMILGVLSCYALGTLWLALELNISFVSATAIGVLPFIIPDLLKIAFSLFLSKIIRKRLKSASLL